MFLTLMDIGGLGCGRKDISQTIKNEMDRKMDNELDSGVLKGIIGSSMSHACNGIFSYE